MRTASQRARARGRTPKIPLWDMLPVDARRLPLRKLLSAEPSESYHLAKRPRPAVAAESMSDATVHDQQVVEDPPRGAIPPLPVPSATHVLPRKPISSLRPLFPDCHR